MQKLTMVYYLLRYSEIVSFPNDFPVSYEQTGYNFEILYAKLAGQYFNKTWLIL